MEVHVLSVVHIVAFQRPLTRLGRLLRRRPICSHHHRRQCRYRLRHRWRARERLAGPPRMVPGSAVIYKVSKFGHAFLHCPPQACAVRALGVPAHLLDSGQ